MGFLNGNMKSETSTSREDRIRKLLYDIYENESSYLIMIDCPGIKKEDIKLRVLDDKVNIRIEDDDDSYLDLDTVYISRYYEKELSISLPDGVVKESVTACYKDGVLSISLNKDLDADEDGFLAQII